MRKVVRVLAQALALALLVGVSVGHAQPASNRARARELYAEGQKAFRAGEFAKAQRAFEDAYRAVPNPVVLLSIAESQVRTEDYAGALASLRQYLSEKPGAADRAQVEAQIANLEAKPGFVSLESAPPGAMIWVDGENTGYLTPNELSLRAGPHTIALTLDGFERFEQPVEVEIGSRQRLSITLTPEAPPVVAEPEPEPTLEQEQPQRVRKASPAVWAAVAVAGVTAITGTGLGVAALAKEKDYKESPSDSLQDKGQRLALFADVNFGIAAVAGITAVVIYLTSAAPPPEAYEQTWVVAPSLTQRELGLSGQLRF